jgi:CO/xanthine dehydrogenase FAD-binding subunit
LTGQRTASVFRKLGSRSYLVISIAMVAVTLVADAHGNIAQARIAVGACSAVAQRLVALEAELKGARIGTGLGELVRPGHLSGLSPIDDVRATAAYRKDAALHLVRRALDDCAARLAT